MLWAQGRIDKYKWQSWDSNPDLSGSKLHALPSPPSLGRLSAALAHSTRSGKSRFTWHLLNSPAPPSLPPYLAPFLTGHREVGGESVPWSAPTWGRSLGVFSSLRGLLVKGPAVLFASSALPLEFPAKGLRSTPEQLCWCSWERV